MNGGVRDGEENGRSKGGGQQFLSLRHSLSSIITLSIVILREREEESQLSIQLEVILLYHLI